jgi:predicted GIY-YIG superfamily endonuclease
MNVYFVRAGNRGAIKVGVARNVERRISTMQTGNPFKLNLLASISCDSRVSAYALEAKIHKFFARQRIRGEWFQGNIDFRKIGGSIIDVDSTKSSPDYEKSTYQPKKKVKKKRTIR